MSTGQKRCCCRCRPAAPARCTCREFLEDSADSFAASGRGSSGGGGDRGSPAALDVLAAAGAAALEGALCSPNAHGLSLYRAFRGCGKLGPAELRLVAPGAFAAVREVGAGSPACLGLLGTGMEMMVWGVPMWCSGRRCELYMATSHAKLGLHWGCAGRQPLQ